MGRVAHQNSSEVHTCLNVIIEDAQLAFVAFHEGAGPLGAEVVKLRHTSRQAGTHAPSKQEHTHAGTQVARQASR